MLEWTSVEVLTAAGLGERVHAEGNRHESVGIAFRNRDILSIDFERLAASRWSHYGQTKIQQDLFAAAERDDLNIIFESSDVEIHDVTTDAPYVTFTPTANTPGWIVTTSPGATDNTV